jgi:hypothetical protein
VVSVADTVAVQFTNVTAGVLDPVPGTLKVAVQAR